jgi:hypothetical protein
MRTIHLTDKQYLIIEHAICMSLMRATESLNDYRRIDASYSHEEVEERRWLATWAELSVAQQRNALLTFRNA